MRAKHIFGLLLLLIVGCSEAEARSLGRTRREPEKGSGGSSPPAPFVDTYGVHLDNVNEYGEVADSATWTFTNGIFSVCFWWKPTTWGTLSLLPIMGKNNTTLLEWDIVTDNTAAQKIRFRVQSIGRNCRDSAATVTLNVWQHRCITNTAICGGTCADTAASMDQYIDGAHADFGTCSVNTPLYVDRALPFRLNRDSTAVSIQGVDAIYTQIAIYNKVITAGEYATIYNGGSRDIDLSISGPTGNLIVYWPLGEAPDAYPTMQDRSANAQHLTLVNTETGDVEAL